MSCHFLIAVNRGGETEEAEKSRHFLFAFKGQEMKTTREILCR